MTSARTNYATTLKWNSSGSYAAIGEVVSLDSPEILNEAVEATNHSSGGWREFVAGGLKEVSEFSATVNFVDSYMTTIYNYMTSGCTVSYQILFPDDGATTWTFSALITSVKPVASDAQSPEALQAEVKFQPSGSCVLA